MSNITIPRGPMRGGQSANLTRQPSSAGPALRDAGAKLFRSATVARQQFEANEFNQARLNMTRDLDALRLEYEQTTDPQAIETGWPERIAGLRERYVGEASNGLQDRVGLTFDTLAQSHALPVARHAQGMRVSQSAGTWREYVQSVGTGWIGAGPEVQANLIAQGDQMIEADLAAGFISPEEAVQRRQQLRVTGLEAEAIGTVDGDPVAFLEAADDGRFDALGGDAVERLRVRARNRLEQDAAAAAREAERVAAATEVQIGKELQFIADLAGDGLTAQQEAGGYMDLPAVQAHPDYAQAAAAIQLRQAIPDLQRMSPAELQDLIAQERGKPIVAKFQAERIAVLERLLETAQSEWSEDPVARAGSVGFNIDPIDMTRLASPSSIEAFKARRQQAEALAKRGYAARPADALLSQDERAALQAQIAQDQPRAQREAVLRSVILGFREDALPLLADMDQSPAVRQAARVMLSGADAVPYGRLTLQAVLKGEEKIAAGTVRLPSTAAVTETIDRLTVGYFNDDPQRRRDITAAALAIYAADAEDLDPSGTRGDGSLNSDEEDSFELALHKALGGSEDQRGNRLGGVQDVRGVMTELPPGVSAEAVETAWERVIAAARGGLTGAGPDPRLMTGAAPGRVEAVSPSLDLLNRAAVNDMKAGDWANADTLRDVAFEPVAGAPGYYVLVRARGGRMMVQPAADGGSFILHLPTLLEVAR